MKIRTLPKLFLSPPPHQTHTWVTQWDNDEKPVSERSSSCFNTT